MSSSDLPRVSGTIFRQNKNPITQTEAKSQNAPAPTRSPQFCKRGISIGLILVVCCVLWSLIRWALGLKALYKGVG